jgi:glutamyl endopeptidase
MTERPIRLPKVKESHPYNTVCHLEIIYARGTNKGTGFVVGPRTIITAGHCVLDPHRGPAVNIVVRPARDGREVPFGECTTGSFDFPEEWQDALKEGQQPAEHDYGAIFLPEVTVNEPPEITIEHLLQWKAFTDDDVRRIVQHSEQANIIGFPNRLHGVMEANNGPLILDENHPLNGRVLYYEMSTHEGQSGGPIIHFDVAAGTSTVYGIHSRALGDGVSVARRIDPDLARTIQLWVDNPFPRLAGALIA